METPRALPLLTVEDDGQFIVHEETLAFLKKQNNPIGIVAVAGLYRTGKSYLLNLLTGGGSSGFAVGSTVNACTKGIWIWSQPSYDAEKNLYVYYMDTEGLGSTSRSSTHDSRIFAIALLLSSYFIYNSRGVIDGQALEDLSLVASLTHVIQSKSGGDGNSSDPAIASANHFFPIFVWVLRDFTLKLEDDKGKKINSNQYLENCLKPQNGFTEAIASKNQIRRLITDSFRERECVTLVRPAEDENILRNLSDHPLADLRPEFSKQMNHLLAKVHNGVRPKQMMCRTLNGEMFCTLVRSYAEALNSGEVPEVNSAWTRVIGTQCQDAKMKALAEYDGALVQELLSAKYGGLGDGGVAGKRGQSDGMTLRDVLPVGIDVLLMCHEKAKAKCKYEYLSKLMEPYEETARSIASQLKAELREKFHDAVRMNKKSSLALSQRHLAEITTKVLRSSGKGTRVSEQVVSTSEVSNQLSMYKMLLSEFDAMLVGDDQGMSHIFGPHVHAVQNAYLSNEFLDDVSMWASGVADDFRNAETAFTAEIHALELNLSKLGSEVAAKGSIFMQQKESDDRVESDLRERIEEEKRRYDDVCRRKEAEKRRYTVMLGEISQMHAATIASMTSRQKELRLKLEREREIVLEEQKRLGADRSQMKAETRSAQEHRENEAEELQQSVEAQETHVEQLKKEIAQANSAHRKALAEKEKVYADALVKEQVYIDSEKDDIIAALKIEYSREEAIKMNEVRELGEQIREKEKELTRLGVSFDRMEEAGGALGTGQAQFVEAHHMKKQGRGKGKKGGGSKGCAQS